MLLTWEQFNHKHSNQKDTFEELCLDVFKVDYGLHDKDIIQYHNQPGGECEPLLVNVKGKQKYITFQSKHFDDKINWSEFEKSLDALIKLKKEKHSTYTNCSLLICYTNKDAKTKNTTRAKLDAKASKESIDIEWIYGESLIRWITNDEKYAWIKRKYFVNYPQPSLIIPKKQDDIGLYKYHFTMQPIPFIGRQKQIDGVIKFLDSSEKFSWWIVTGSAGSGKSRFALDMCTKASSFETAWKAGFITRLTELERFINGQPTQPTLIIIDYVIGEEEYIANSLYEIIQHNTLEQFQYPVRIILLEREQDIWFDRLMSSGTKKLALEQSLYSQDPVHLPPFSEETEDIQNQLADELIKKYNPDSLSSKELLEKASQIDPKNSVLFMHFIANLDDAYSAGSKEEVLREVIHHDKVHRWVKNGISEEDEKLLVFATLCKSIELSEISHSNRHTLLKQHNIMTGKKSSSLTALEPDVLGELYVLDYFQYNQELDCSEFKTIIDQVLMFESHNELLGFFTRAVNDFPSHPSLECLKTPFGNEIEYLTLWAKIVVNVIYFLEPSKFSTDLFISLEKHVVPLIGSNPEFATYLQHAFHNYMNVQMNENKWAHLFNLESIQQDETSELDLKKVNIPFASNLGKTNEIPVKKLSRLNITTLDFDYLQITSGSIEALIDKQIPLSPSFFKRLFQLYELLELHYVENRNFLEALKVHEKFSRRMTPMLQTSVELQKDTLISHVRATTNLIVLIHQMNLLNDDPNSRKGYVNELFKHLTYIYENTKPNDFLVEELAKACAGTILIFNSMRPNDKDLAIEYFNKLNNLFNKYPENIDIMQQIANSLVNISSGFRDETDYNDFRLHLKNFEDIVKQKDKHIFNEQLAQAYGNLVAFHKDFVQKDLQELTLKLENIVYSSLDNHLPAKAYLRSLTTKHQNCLNQKEYKKARRYFNSIKKINMLFPNTFISDYIYQIEKGMQFTKEHSKIFLHVKYWYYFHQLDETYFNDQFYRTIAQNMFSDIINYHNEIQRTKTKSIKKWIIISLYKRSIMRYCTINNDHLQGICKSTKQFLT